MSERQVIGGGAPAFSPSDAAFEGLRLARREPKAVLAWAALSLGVSLASTLALIGFAGPALAQFQTLRTAGAGAATPNPAAMLATMSGLVPAYLVIMLVTLAFYAVMNAAVLRAVMRPEERAFAYLRFGAAELRQLAVLVLIGLLFLAVYVAVTLAIVLVAVVIGAGAAGAGGAAGGSPNFAVIGVVALVELALFVVLIAAMLVLAVRFSLASALTFATGRVRVFGSWGLTRRRFWPLFGAYLLAGVLMALMLIALMVVFGVVAAVAGGPAAAGFMFRPDMSSFAAYFRPLQIAYLVVSAPVSAVWIAMQVGVPGRAYAQLTANERVADVFGPSASDRSTAFGTQP